MDNKKKKIIEKVLKSMPTEVRKKIIEAHKQGKKIKLKIKKKDKDIINSPYQDE